MIDENKSITEGREVYSETLMFHIYGQPPFGEWLKKLNLDDRPPRGRCNHYFVAHKHINRAKAFTDIAGFVKRANRKGMLKKPL